MLFYSRLFLIEWIGWFNSFNIIRAKYRGAVTSKKNINFTVFANKKLKWLLINSF